MRELKDYFCNFEQTQELLKLGLNDNYGITADYYKTEEFAISGFLRSQALDYFMDLGYSAGFRGTTPYNWYLIERPDKSIMSIKSGNYISHVHCESALIDKLIELEKEARNGK